MRCRGALLEVEVRRVQTANVLTSNNRWGEGRDALAEVALYRWLARWYDSTHAASFFH